MQKRRELSILVTLFLSSTIIGAESILIPTYSTLFDLFPDNAAAINFIMTGCYAVSVVIALLVGRISRVFRYKTILIIAAATGAISGVGTFLFIRPAVISVMRALMMVAYTFSNTVVILYITEMYADAARRGRILGYYVAAQMAVSAILAVVSGYLATFSLKLAYSLHFLILLYLAALIFFLPSQKKSRQNDTPAQEKKKNGEKMGKTYWSMLLNFAFFNFSFCVIFYYTSIYVAENHLGSEALSGALNAVCTGCSFVVSFLYGRLTKRFGGHALVAAHISAILGGLLLWLYPAVWSAALGIALISFASGFMRVFYYDALPAVVPESRTADSVAFLEGFQFLMTCIITYVISGLMSLLHVENFTQILILPVVLFLCTAAIAYIFQKKNGFRLGR